MKHELVCEDLLSELLEASYASNRIVNDAINIAALFDVEKESRRICVRALIKRAHNKLNILEEDIINAIK